MRGWRRGMRVAAACAGACALGAPAAVAAGPTRYSLAHDCVALASPGATALAAAGPLRLQPTRLAHVLLYTRDRRVLADGPGGIAPVAAPSPAAEWRVDGDADAGFTVTDVATGRRLAVTVASATGCADHPEAEVNATGDPARGTAPTGAVEGTVDTHGHLMGFELFGGAWHCGRPWHPYGVAYALPDCSSMRRGTNGLFTEVLETGSPVGTRDPRGWPTFKDWPKPSTVASEGDYWTGLERAWRGGLRILVSLAVDNEALCAVMTERRAPCDDMASARRQIRDLHELQDYIDAQSGGPGKGFFRIVSDPVTAREVINRGQLAVVVGIEVSRLLGCGERFGASECDRADVDRGLDELERLGVTSFFPVHKFDNAFGGTKMDPGEQGVIVGAGNVVATGQFWEVETCPTAEHDNDLITAPGASAAAQLLAAPLDQLVPGGAAAPLYPPGPHCNTRGLTDLGRHLVEEMMRRRFVVELDHMDVRTADTVLGLLEARGYSGVMSSHATPSQISPQLLPRIYRLGGFVSPVTNPSPKAFLDLWQLTQAARDGRYVQGVGYGSDMNGLAPQSHPGDETGDRIAYPFRSLDGRVTFDRERWGRRVFDVNADGVANYGMYPDWLEQVVRRGGDGVRRDLLRGAEAYLEMWERATGIAPTTCRPAATRMTAAGLGPLRLGATAKGLLVDLGQPSSRPGRSYRWCVAGTRATARVVFDGRGRAVLVARTLGTPAPGAREGLRIGRAGRGGARLVRRVRGGRTRWVAAVAAPALRSPARLRATLRAAGLR